MITDNPSQGKMASFRCIAVWLFNIKVWVRLLTIFGLFSGGTNQVVVDNNGSTSKSKSSVKSIYHHSQPPPPYPTTSAFHIPGSSNNNHFTTTQSQHQQPKLKKAGFSLPLSVPNSLLPSSISIAKGKLRKFLARENEI